jgi:hypothetical protein
MKKLFLIFLLSFLAVTFSYGQTGNATLYNTGKPLTSCECNFENLFANWGPAWVTNHDTIKFISYEFVETLSDTARILFYIEEFISFDTPLFKRHSWMSYDDQTKKHIGEYYIYPDSTTRQRYDAYPESKDKFMDEWNRLFEDCKNYWIPLIKIGDKVFVIKYKSGDKIYEKYVICRPGENTIVFDGGTFLGIREIGWIDKYRPILKQ